MPREITGLHGTAHHVVFYEVNPPSFCFCPPVPSGAKTGPSHHEAARSMIIVSNAYFLTILNESVIVPVKLPLPVIVTVAVPTFLLFL